MYKVITLFVVLFTSVASLAQDAMFEMGVASFRAEKEAVFKDPEKSPLTEKDRKTFDGLPYYPANEKYRVKADFKRVRGSVIEMPTTTDRIAKYRPYGELHFEVNGQSGTLTVYESVSMGLQKEPEDETLFLPFTDETNGLDTYGGGRYIDIAKQDDDQWVLDFNLAYNPYCAYNGKYSCPIPPRNNRLEMSIEAGVKYDSKH